MTDTTQIELDYLRLTALASDMQDFVKTFDNRLTEDHLYTLHELHAQLRGMSALLVQDDFHKFVNVVIDTALNEFVHIQWKLGLFR